MEFAVVFQWRNLVSTATGSGSNSFEPYTFTFDERIEFRPLIVVTPQVKMPFEQGNSKIHFPEPLKKVISGIFSEMGIGEMMKPLPKFFDKAPRFDAARMISRIQIGRIFAGPINEKTRGVSRHLETCKIRLTRCR